jgi:hypothetical protein
MQWNKRRPPPEIVEKKGDFLNKIGKYKPSSVVTRGGNYLLAVVGLYSHAQSFVDKVLKWISVLLQRLIVFQLPKKFSEFHGSWRFIVVFTRFHHLSVL